MSTRTPGPWYEGRQAGRSKHGQEMIASEANGKTVAVVYDADADAAFIVEACNAHDALTAGNAALREALRACITDEGACCYQTGSVHALDCRIKGINAEARAALALLDKGKE